MPRKGTAAELYVTFSPTPEIDYFQAPRPELLLFLFWNIKINMNVSYAATVAWPLDSKDKWDGASSTSKKSQKTNALSSADIPNDASVSFSTINSCSISDNWSRQGSSLSLESDGKAEEHGSCMSMEVRALFDEQEKEDCFPVEGLLTRTFPERMVAEPNLERLDTSRHTLSSRLSGRFDLPGNPFGVIGSKTRVVQGRRNDESKSQWASVSVKK